MAPTVVVSVTVRIATPVTLPRKLALSEMARSKPPPATVLPKVINSLTPESAMSVVAPESVTGLL